MSRQAIGSHTEIVDPAGVSSDEADGSPLQSANSPVAIHVVAIHVVAIHVSAIHVSAIHVSAIHVSAIHVSEIHVSAMQRFTNAPIPSIST